MKMQDRKSGAMSPVPATLSFPYLPRRVAVAREKSGLTQTKLSQLVGFKDRQTLASIESGERRVSAQELITIMQATGFGIDFFTDPFLLVDEGAFSYRASGVNEKVLDGFEEHVRGWIALWKHLGERCKECPNPLRFRLAFDANSTFEDAQIAAERVAVELNLTDIPAENLISAIDERFHLLVLSVDMPKGVSGAACQIASGDVILTNRMESEGRRNFDLAHELFHVLTWDAHPPQRVDRENPKGYKQKRIEQLADNFAGALLMPAKAIKAKWESKRATMDLADWVSAAADHFRVSTAALKWRLVALELLTKDAALSLKDRKQPTVAKNRPLLFSRRFVKRIAWGIEHGEVSVRRLAELLGMDIPELKKLFPAHGIATPFDL